MRLTRHAVKRILQRGVDLKILEVIEDIVPPDYRNQSQQIFFTKRIACEIAHILRNTADRIEKHAGTTMVLDPSGSTLITVYRKGSR